MLLKINLIIFSLISCCLNPLCSQELKPIFGTSNTFSVVLTQISKFGSLQKMVDHAKEIDSTNLNIIALKLDSALYFVLNKKMKKIQIIYNDSIVLSVRKGRNNIDVIDAWCKFELQCYRYRGKILKSLSFSDPSESINSCVILVKKCMRKCKKGSKQTSVILSEKELIIYENWFDFYFWK
jgi:hypothetical protein